MRISNLTSSYHIFSSLCIKFGTKVMASTDASKEKILYLVEFLISEWDNTTLDTKFDTGGISGQVLWNETG
jgi:hypothetical protein